ANDYMVPPNGLNEREQFLRLDEAFDDETLIADLTIEWDLGAVDLTSVTSYINRHILVSRVASALPPSVSIALGYPRAGIELPSNLRDVTDLQQMTQEIRLASDYGGPFEWLIGAFYTDIDREYSQRLPTPGYDFYTDATLGAGTAAATSNGYGPDSPYNSDLPYEIRQFATFGEASYDLT